MYYDSPLARKTHEAHLAKIARNLHVCSQGYNAKKLKATIMITGIDVTGKPFANMINMEEANEYLKAFFNDYGAALATEVMTIEAELSK